MASEPVEELPDDLEAWVAERAAADGTSRADVVRRLMAAHRLLDEQPDRLDEAAASDADGDPAAVGPEEVVSNSLAAEIDDLDARVDDLTDRVGGVETDLDEKITDVRQRVIQVKREADAKAPTEHDHPELERRVNEGFENYEEVLEYLTERTDDLANDAGDRGAKLRTVANAVVDLRKRVTAIENIAEERAAVAALRESANRQGIVEAACGSCGESVRLGLLDEPACPHCESPFDGVEPGGWFRSARLTVGDVPALEGTTPDAADGATPSGTDSMPSNATADPSQNGGDAPQSNTDDGSDADGRSETNADPDAAGQSETDVPSTGADPDADSGRATDATPDADPPPEATNDDPEETRPAENLGAVDFSSGAVEGVGAGTDGSGSEADSG
jgi:prefoldin subunit 5